MILKLVKKLSIISTALVLMVSSSGIVGYADNSDFDEFLTDEFRDRMEGDYLTFHYGIKDYNSFDLEKPNVSLGEVNYGVYEEEVEGIQASLDKLASFDYNSLSDSQKISYDAYKFYLENSLKLNQYPDFDEYFNPYSGALSNLITNFTEFVFRERQDIDDYLTLLEDTPRFIDEMMEMTRIQASKGFFMNDETLDEAKKNIDEFTAKTEDSALIVIFDNNVDEFEGLTDAERQEYKTRNRDIVLNQIIPAYEKAKNDLEALRGSRNNPDGTAGYPNGKEYFEALAQYKSSSDLTLEEMANHLEDGIESIYNWMINDIIVYASERGNFEPDNVTMSEPDEILNYLQNHLDSFPKGPEVTYRADYLDPSVATPSVMAYYLSPPIDDIKDNVIKINGDIVGEDNTTLYYTLAHEGFPGHLYQFTYYFDKNPNPLRTDLSFLGYTEGWAQYVEILMLDQVGLDEFSSLYHRANTLLGYGINALADIGVNGLGWDVAELTRHIEPYGFDEETAIALRDAVIGMPGQIIPYGFGLIEYYNQRDKAEQAFGADFNEVEYHKVILDEGPRPLHILSRDIDNYITSSGKQIPENYSAFGTQAKDAQSAVTGTVGKYLKYAIIGIVAVLALIIALIVFLVRRSRRKKKERIERSLAQENEAIREINQSVVEKSQEIMDREKGTFEYDHKDEEPKE